MLQKTMASKHTILTFGFIFLFGIAILASALDSEDIDEICNVNGSILFRDPVRSEWICGNLTDTMINVTVNNITNLYTNWSVHANYWDDLDSPDDLPNTFGIWTNDSGIAQYIGDVNVTGDLDVYLATTGNVIGEGISVNRGDGFFFMGQGTSSATNYLPIIKGKPVGDTGFFIRGIQSPDIVDFETFRFSTSDHTESGPINGSNKAYTWYNWATPLMEMLGDGNTTIHGSLKPESIITTGTASLPITFTDDGSNVVMDVSSVAGNNYFGIESDGAFLQLYSNPNPSIDYLLFTVTETQGADTFLNFYEGGTGHNRFWDSGSARFGGEANSKCDALTTKVDCDTPLTGADVVVQDDIWAGGDMIAGNGSAYLYENGTGWISDRFVVMNNTHFRGTSCIGYGDATCNDKHSINVKATSFGAFRIEEPTVDTEYFQVNVNSAGDLQFYSDSGALAMQMMDSSRFVGIGTGTPKNKLDVEGSVAIGAGFSGGATCSANGMCVEGYSTFGFSDSGYSQVHTTSFGANLLRLFTTNTTYIPDDTDHTILTNATDGNITVTLPSCAFKSNEDRIYYVVAHDMTNGTFTVHINSSLSGETVGGVTKSILRNPKESVGLQCDSDSDWIIISHFEGGYLI